MNKTTDLKTLPQAELAQALKATGEELRSAQGAFDAQFWEHLQTHLPLSARVHLFTECLRVAYQRDRDVTRDQKAVDQYPGFAFDQYPYADFKGVVERAERLLGFAYLSQAFHPPDSGLRALAAKIFTLENQYDALLREDRRRAGRD